MNKMEFNELTNRPFTDADYKIIEYVYNYYPCLDWHRNPKQHIAALYTNYGMRIIKDMLPTAKKAERLEEAERNLKMQMAKIQGFKESLQDGTDGEEGL